MRLFPDRIDLAPGETAMVEVHVTRNGYCGAIDVAINGLPEGVQAEMTSVPWPEAVATVELKAADTLSDSMRIITVRTRTSQNRLFELDLRTRAALADWTDEDVGIRHTRRMRDATLLGGNRIVFLDYERTVLGDVIPIVQCIDLGVGRCVDFGESGAVALELQRIGNTHMAGASNGSAIVATPTSDSSASPGSLRQTRWHRITAAGDLLTLPGLASAAIDTAVIDVAVDSNGRIVFLSQPNGSSETYVVRLMPDGSLDESFGDAGSRPAVWWPHRIHLIPDGRIVLNGLTHFTWLEEDGTPIGASIFVESHVAEEALDDGSVIYGHTSPADEPNSTGYVTLLDSAGTVMRRWELGWRVEPRAFLQDGDDLLVAARVDDSGLLRVMRLPLNDVPVTIAERTVGSSGWPACVIDSGSLFVVGSRHVKLPDDDPYWGEAFVWRVE